MKTLRYKSYDPSVYLLEELLNKLGYNVYISNYFGIDTHNAIKDFQQKNNLVVDGIVGLKTWSKLLEAEQEFLKYNAKLLSEQDLIEFSQTYNLDLAVVKAVNEIESSGKGFLTDGRPKILFEGHIFWRELKNRGIDPSTLVNNNSKDVLYDKWTKKYYLGGSGEYKRLEKALKLSPAGEVHDAAYCSASWGAFQIMGYHYNSLGYNSIDDFVKKMYDHEREHLRAFGKFLEVNNLIRHLKNKDWTKFAKGYNGTGYKLNKYDEKLEKAYKKYSS
ncbi:N-acetylmuramidase domain-containing protein [Abyssalbus ytuae]|uniref:N-acetylmuramidase family protein n=1 Tax=Abyssalbus ytuae TaxID=2926907 RepID=A0A9E7CTV0_9FLAO|nr:N-acetylmuramidase family protein [Abyssalbus ytuae]UOB18746.1 N-acetylmuramidase family protein [Abyssalbus ytuae]